MITTEHINQAEIESRFKEATIRIIANDPVKLHKAKTASEQMANIVRLILDLKSAQEKIRSEYESYFANWTPEELLYLASKVCSEMAMSGIVSRLKEFLGGQDEDEDGDKS